MSSAAQINANQLNSQSSTGPISVEGKTRASLNALRYGFTSQVVIVEPAQAALYQQHCADYHRDFAPVGKVETDLTQDLADLRWSIDRIRSHETSLFALQGQLGESPFQTGDPSMDSALAIANALPEIAPTLARLSLYESRKSRAFEKSLGTLREIQKERQLSQAAMPAIPANEPQPVETNRTVHKLASFVQMPKMSRAPILRTAPQALPTPIRPENPAPKNPLRDSNEL